MSGGGCFSVLDIEYILHVLHKVHGYKITLEQGLEFFNDLRGAVLVCGYWLSPQLSGIFLPVSSHNSGGEIHFVKDLVLFEKLVVERKHA